MTSIRTLAPVGAAFLALTAGASTASAASQQVTLRFTAVAGDQHVDCATPITGLGSPSTTAKLQDLRFFVSDVRLLRKNGSSAKLAIKPNKNYRVAGAAGSVSLIDLENGTGDCAEEGTPGTNALVVGSVPKGAYTGVRFTLGVPFKLSHTDTVGAPGPLGLAAMAWSWQYGRKFVKIELADPAGPTGGTWASPDYYLHVGSTGCTGNPASGATVSCGATNASTVTLAKFNAATQAIALDLATLFAKNDLTKSPDMMPGCMSGQDDPECGPLFASLGIAWSADGKGTGRSTGNQTAFRAIDR